MFTLWYIYLGFQEFRRQGYFQWWVQWWKNQDNTVALSSAPSPSPTEDTILDTKKMDDIPSSTERNDLPRTIIVGGNETTSTVEDNRLNKTDTVVVPSVKPAPTPIATKVDKPVVYDMTDASDEILKRSKHVASKVDVADPESLIMMGKTKFNDSFVSGDEDDEEEDDDVTDEYLAKAKDSKLLIAAEVSDKRKGVPAELSDPSKGLEKKKISFPDDSGTGRDLRSNSAHSGHERQENDSATVSGGRGHALLEGSDEPMRCWLTEGDHPDHPAGINTGTGNHNIKLMSNRTRDSADSILRDSDDFIMNERNISRQISWPKKVSISEDPPTTFIRDIPPADEPEITPNASPAEKLIREAELAAAAAAALKEDWRKKMEMDSVDPDDDETIVFGDSDNPDSDPGKLLELSDDEEDFSDSRLRKTDNAQHKYSSKMVDAAVIEKLETGFKKLQASDSKSLLKKYLTQEIFDKLKNLKTPTFGSSLLDVIQSGLENHDSGVGIYAPDAEAYTTFADLFDPIIEDYHGGFKKTDKHPAKDFGDVDTFTDLDPAGEYIISTRVRCGRSMEGYPFNPCLTEAQYKEMEEKVSSTLSGLSGELKGNFFPLTGMTKEVQQKLIDDHFLFKEGDRFLQAANACRFWPTGRGIYHNDSKTFLVWCNEEDHLRIISMQMGGNLGQVYRRLVSAVNDIEKRVPFSHNDRLGFLTFCPTNLGTTIRASVHIKVPKLAANLAKLEEVAGKFNLQVRGTRGEHTEAEGGVYDISNKRRMGLTEFQAVKEMNDGIAELIKIEREL